MFARSKGSLLEALFQVVRIVLIAGLFITVFYVVEASSYQDALNANPQCQPPGDCPNIGSISETDLPFIGTVSTGLIAFAITCLAGLLLFLVDTLQKRFDEHYWRPAD